MKTWHWVSISILLGVILRCAPVWSSIFTHGYVNFASPDSYIMIERFWLVSWASGSLFLEHFVVFVPVVLFVLTAVMVYFIGKEIFSPRAGIVAVFVFSLLPGEYLGRSILGEIDYHALEVFLTTGIVLCILILFKRIANSIVAVFIKGLAGFLLWLSFYVYLGAWSGAFLFLPVLIAFTIPVQKWVGISLLVVSLGLLAWVGLSSNFSLATLQTTVEAQPGFTGIFPTLHILLAGGLLFMKQGGKFRWPLFVWTLILIIATIAMRRFDYYLIVPMAILLGGMVEKFKLAILRPALVVIFLVFCLPGYILSYKPIVPSPAWHEALEWVKESTPQDSIVVSWWDYGYWIKYIGQREAYINPGQDPPRVKGAAEWFIEGKIPLDLLEKNVYLIIDSHMVGDFIPAMRVWAGEKDISYPFIASLYNSRVTGYEFEFYSDGVFLFRYLPSTPFQTPPAEHDTTLDWSMIDSPPLD